MIIRQNLCFKNVLWVHFQLMHILCIFVHDLILCVLVSARAKKELYSSGLVF